MGDEATSAHGRRAATDTYARPVAVIYADAADPGGSAEYAITVAAGLVRRGYRVAAVCHAGPTVASMRERLAQAGVAVHAIEDGGLSLFGRLRRVRSFVSLVRAYRGCVLLLLMGNYVGGGPIALAGTLGGARAIVRADLQPPMPPVTWDRIALLRLKDLFVDRIVVGAAQNKDAFVQLTGRRAEKIEVIHTGIELRRYEPRSTNARVDGRGVMSRPLVVGTVSRLSEPRKGIGVFIEMASLLARRLPEATFVIVGDGDLRHDLEAQAKRLGIFDRTTFTGWRADVPEAIAGMDVFVMPSLFEGGPTTVLEAMAMGVPVVATRVGMVPDVITDWVTGVVVEPGDAQALADAVARLLSDSRLRTQLGDRAREEALRSFSADRMVDRYAELLSLARAEPSRA